MIWKRKTWVKFVLTLSHWQQTTDRWCWRCHILFISLKFKVNKHWCWLSWLLRRIHHALHAVYLLIVCFRMIDSEEFYFNVKTVTYLISKVIDKLWVLIRDNEIWDVFLWLNVSELDVSDAHCIFVFDWDKANIFD